MLPVTIEGIVETGPSPTVGRGPRIVPVLESVFAREEGVLEAEKMYLHGCNILRVIPFHADARLLVGLGLTGNHYCVAVRQVPNFRWVALDIHGGRSCPGGQVSEGGEVNPLTDTRASRARGGKIGGSKDELNREQQKGKKVHRWHLLGLATMSRCESPSRLEAGREKFRELTGPSAKIPARVGLCEPLFPGTALARIGGGSVVFDDLPGLFASLGCGYL
jgi:hypothetical protein